MSEAYYYKTGSWAIYFCSCKHPVHQVCVEGDEYDVTIGMHLEYPCGFWRRLVKAVQYLCGLPSKYGHYDVVILNRNTAMGMGEHLIELAQNITKEGVVL